MNVFSDFYSRVQNAQRMGDSLVILPWTHKTWRFALILKRLKYIEDFKILSTSLEGRKYLPRNYFKKEIPKVSIQLIPGGFSYLRQVSKPSRRVIRKAKEIKLHPKPYGSFILSTTFGLLTCHEAKTMNVGGEIMCEIY